MSKTILFVALALLVGVYAAQVELSAEQSTEIDIDATLGEMAAVADSHAELLSMQTEAAKKGGKKATNGVQRLVKMLRKVIRRTRASLRAAGQNRAAQKKECKRIFTTAKAKTPIAQAEIKTLKTKLQLAINAIARSKNDVSSFKKKVADAVAEGNRFDSLQKVRRGEATLNANRWTAANSEAQALIALLSSIKGNLKANGLAEISSELTDAAHAHAEQESMLLAIAAVAEKGGKKGMAEVHDMIDLLIANLKKDIAANLANIKQGAAMLVKLTGELAKSANSARANSKSFLKSQGDVSAAGDRAAKDVLAFNIRIRALEAKVANTIKRVATTKVRCAASKKRFVGKKARSLKKIRVLKAIIKQLKNTKLSPAMVAKIAGLKLDKAVWSKGAWGACSTKCGLGKKTRAVTCSGKHCKGRKPATKEACTAGACKVACVVSKWTRFSKCAGGVQQRTRKVLVRASNGGKACPSTAGLVHKRGCTAAAKGNPKMVAKFAKKTAAIKKKIAATKVAAKKAVAAVKNLVKNVKNVKSKAVFIQVKAKLLAVVKKAAALKKKEGKLQTAKFESKLNGWEFSAAGVAANKFCTSKRLTGIAHVGCMHDIKLAGDRQIAAAAAAHQKRVLAAQRAAAPRACQVSGWSAFGACSSRCGGGKQTRTRKVTAAAANNGKSCPTLRESRNCNTKACPVDCKLSAWTPWSACSKRCGGGVQTQTRKISRNAANGGRGCPTSTKQTQACNTHRCPPPPAPPARAQAANKCTKNSCPRPPTIPRNTQNAPSRWATANGDPHQTNFNGDYFHMQLPQIITMAKTDDGLFEVQAYQDGWRGPGSYSAIREVKIRYGNQIFHNNFNRDGFIVQGGSWYVNVKVPGAYQNKMQGAFGANQARGSATNFKDQNGKLVNVHWNGGGGAQHWGLSGYGGGSTGISRFQKAWKPTMNDCLFTAARCAANLRLSSFDQLTRRVCTPWGCIDMGRFR